ncbi:MAG: NAD+ synthase [Sphingomonadales bacterium]|jgi:NAD+ synthase
MTHKISIAIAQVNPVVGAIADNAAMIRAYHARAADLGIDLIAFPEMVLMGYPPEDMVLKPAFQSDARKAVEALAKITKNDAPAILLGTAWVIEERLHNALILLDDGEIKAVRAKYELPNYGVFDEIRVFAQGALDEPVEFRGIKLGLMICEDMWLPRVAKHLKKVGADILIVPNASPYEVDKLEQRCFHAQARARETGLPLMVVNQLGGQDELVFDGASFVVGANADIQAQLPAWEEVLEVTHWTRSDDGWVMEGGHKSPVSSGLQSIYQAMVLGLRDYVEKNKFPSVIIGLSGGVDSALTAAVAVDALGADRVRCVMMPSRYTSQESLEDAKACAKALDVELDSISIEDGVAAFDAMLGPLFEGLTPDTTEENIQARIRGILLMALSNKSGAMVVTTGNKSEMSVGYATLYGDMCGGYSVLKDIYKTTVFELCHWRNEYLPKTAQGPKGQVIPERIITKPPSAELRADQKDEDSLPPYEALDDMLRCLIEEEMGVDDIVARGHDRETVKRIEHLLYVAEYKRRQAPPGVKISSKNFGRDRRYPITNGFRDAIDFDFHRWSDE